MNEIQIFNNPQFGEVRVAMTESNEPMFCLADVCKALEISNVGNVKQRLTEKGIRSVDTLTNGGMQSMTYISEANLYKCIFQSRKPDAEKFQDWVCDEVLPSIRKHGAYMTQTVIERTLTDPDYLIQLATALKEERQQRVMAEKRADVEAEINKVNAPKVLFANAVVGSRSTCLIGELAKMLQQNGYPIGQNRLFKWLRDNNYLGRHGERYNIPNQQYIEMGLFELKKGVRSGHDGVMKTTLTPKVTGKGQQYFINKFLSV